jgi:hypothetical protein
VFRPITFLLALLLAGSPDLSLVCKAWCAGRDTATASCHHHEGQGARFTHDQTCSEDSLDVRNVVTKSLQSVSPPSAGWLYASSALFNTSASHGVLASAADRAQSDLLGFLIPTVLRI